MDPIRSTGTARLSSDTIRGQLNRGCWLAAIVLSVVADIGSAFGQCEVAKWLASDGAAFDNFGYAVAIDGDVAIVGSRHDDDLGNDAGSAYIYRSDGTSWAEEAHLLASDGAANHGFGRSVAISAGVAVIGTTGAQSAYVFSRIGSEWIETVKLTPWDSHGAGFGVSVALEGGLAVVGAWADSEVCLTCGAAYIFRHDGVHWVPEAKLRASDAQSGNEMWDMFGWSVSVRENLAIVGKPRNTFPFPWGPGAAYVYRFDGATWAEEAQLLASDGVVGDGFGTSVALGDDMALVGAPNLGSAYLFRLLPVVESANAAEWIEEALLDNPRSPGSDFGQSVALSGEVAIVGAPRDDENGNDSGSAFVFVRTEVSWIEDVKLLPSDGEAGDLFGSAVEMSGDVTIIGAHGDDDGASGVGSAYVLNVGLETCPLLGDFDGDGTVGISDFLILLLSWGLCSEPQGACLGDLDGDGLVGIADFLILLANWS